MAALSILHHQSKNLGVLFDSNLSFDSHVSRICKTAFFHLNIYIYIYIYKLRPMLSMSNAEMLIYAFMTSRLDYCNALLGRCSARLNYRWFKMQQLEVLLEPEYVTALARFCQHCTGSLLNIV